MTFEIGGKKVTLTRSIEAGECKLITGKRMLKMLQHEGNPEAQLYSIYAMELGEHWMEK